ncbi:MAG: hypothetical protein ACREMV_00995 [Gemmatimonadales bacterium]
MRGLWLLVHFLGFTLWLGGGIATMVAGVTAKRWPPDERLAAYRLTAAIQRILVGPGAIGVVLSGLVLSVDVMKATTVPGGVLVMMAAGLLGAHVVVGLSVPTAARLGRLDLDPRGEMPEAFAGLRKRQIWTASLAGGLGLLALVAATMR